jgi:signal transduction histidine kinase
MKFRTIYLFILLFFVGVESFAEPVLVFDPTVDKMIIGGKVMVIQDGKSSYSLEQIIQNDSGAILLAPIPNLGVTENVYWLKFKLNNLSDSRLILKFNQPLLDEVVLYTIRDGKKVTEVRYGEHRKFYERKYDYPAYAFDLNLNKGDTGTYILKFKSKEPIMLDISVGKEDTIWGEEIKKEITLGIYIGIILVMVFYNLFIFFTVLDVSYLVYVAYIISVGLTQITLQGYGFKYLWPDLYWFNDIGVVLFSALGAIFAIEFLKMFLKTKEHVPILHKFLTVFEVVFIISVCLLANGSNLLAFSIVQLTTMLLSFYILFVAIKVLINGFRPAIFFLIAWIVLLVAAFIFISKDFGILPYNFFTVYAMQIGSSLEVILLSFALADRINILKKEKDESQTQTLNALRENERIIKEQNVILESKVTERTYELKQSNQDLTTTLTELKQTQSQLVNAEKMASLGQLTAGIAHEINNPINFVVSNVKPLQRDIEDIQELVSKYEALETNGSINEKINEINKFRKEIDYDYIKEEISTLLKGIEEGASRTADIVKGLRVFSRLDENDLKRTNIVDGIESTITLLNPEISGSIDLVKKFENTPSIECFPGKMNQVFMNILNNAIFAIKANKDRTEKGKLEITTYVEDQYVCIRIKDNGTGMSEEVKAKVFEPFFTTKDVGKGTGLGMSITFSIIEDHKGSIEVNSEVGKGTEFIIKLPINHK